MFYISVDQSFTSTGFCIFNDTKMVTCGVIKSTKTEDPFFRAHQISTELSKIANKYNARIVVLEGLAFAKLGNATRDLAGLQYTIIHQLRFIDGIELKIVTPNEVKRTATGRGNARKDEMVDALPANIRAEFDKLKAKKTTGLYDLSDAYWIGKTIQIQEIN